MINLVELLNRLAGGGRGNIISVKFTVEDKRYEALVPDDQLWIAVKDVLLNREYEYLPEFELSNYRGATIVDAGAHVGLYSLLASHYARKVIAIEAHPVNYHLLTINKIINNADNIIPLNKALVGRPRRKILVVDGEHSGDHRVAEAAEGQRAYEVATITLEELVRNLGHIDLLKIDVEGAEFEVFKSTDMGALRKIDAIVGEIHLNHGNLDKILTKLKKAGFKVAYFNPPLVKKSNREIKVVGLRKLKAIRNAVYTLTTLAKIRDEELAIIFATRK